MRTLGRQVVLPGYPLIRREYDTKVTRAAAGSLANRAYVPKRLTRNVEAGTLARSCSATSTGFKGVKDALGHSAGEELLCQVAEGIRGCVRRADLVARLGGDEFVVVVENLSNPAVAQAVARAIADGLTEPWTLGQSEVVVVFQREGRSLHSPGHRCR